MTPRTWKPSVWCCLHNVGCDSPIGGPGYDGGGHGELCYACERQRLAALPAEEVSRTEVQPCPEENVNHE